MGPMNEGGPGARHRGRDDPNDPFGNYAGWERDLQAAPSQPMITEGRDVGAVAAEEADK